MDGARSVSKKRIQPIGKKDNLQSRPSDKDKIRVWNGENVWVCRDCIERYVPVGTGGMECVV